MPNQIWLSQLEKHRAIAVIRAPKIELGQQMAMAVASGGLVRSGWGINQSTTVGITSLYRWHWYAI